MATLTVRNLDDDLKARLRMRAAGNGRSMEAETRAILSATLAGGEARKDRLGSRIHGRFAGLAGDQIEVPRRDESPRAADLGA